MKLKNITFIFENCDAITIEGKFVGRFHVDNFGRTITGSGTSCINYESMRTFAIQINKKANTERTEFYHPMQCFKETTFERFTKYQDITDIKLSFEDEDGAEKEFSYVLGWYDDAAINLSSENPYQKTYISACGDLYIVVDKNKDIDDFYNKDDINDPDYAEYYWHLESGDGE